MSISPPPSKRRRQDSRSEASSKPEGHEQLSIYSWNVNGIDPLLQTSIQSFWQPRQEGRPSPPIRDFLRRHGWPNLCFLQEVKINTDDRSKLRIVQRSVSNISEGDSPDYEARFCLPSRRRYRANAKVYGVCTLIRRDYLQGSVDRVYEVDWDAEGRILVLETKATSSMPKLAIFNVYLVNGTDLPYRDETGKTIGTRHDRKLEVHKLLQAECAKLEAKGFGVILAGDINIARSDLDGHPGLRVWPSQHVINRADFERRFFTVAEEGNGTLDEPSGLGMIDTYRFLHPTQRGYTYYTRSVPFGDSCDRVDMIIVSRSLIDRCITAGMHATTADRSSSDHVPLFARFKLK